MKQTATILLLILSVFFLSLLWPIKALAVSFFLTEPEPPFSQDQEIEYTININTQGETLTSIEAEMIFDTDYLEYISTTAGAIFPNVSADEIESGILQISATVNPGDPGVTGTGTFAVVRYRLTGSPQDDVELCAVTVVTPTPSPSPTTPPSQPTPTTSLEVTNTPIPTTPPQPTSPPPTTPVTTLPRTGTMENIIIIATLGLFFASFGFGLLKVK